ncbi:MAG: hypothetical protein CMM96_06730 [Rickettsiales bacterium]|nr:hypothetical protein [Rickettsiales bacterium]|tara:strand:- start:302 stop:724 length:423 start_codon:yes stop_codon:yes gene_type:complete
MDFLINLFELKDAKNFFNVIVFILVINIILIFISYYYDKLSKEKYDKRFKAYETSLKDLVEEFRSFEVMLVEQKKTMDEYKYNFQRIEQEISRLADSHSSEQNVTLAINLAKKGLDAESISKQTGLPIEEVNPIIKYHGG